MGLGYIEDCKQEGRERRVWGGRGISDFHVVCVTSVLRWVKGKRVRETPRSIIVMGFNHIATAKNQHSRDEVSTCVWWYNLVYRNSGKNISNVYSLLIKVLFYQRCQKKKHFWNEHYELRTRKWELSEASDISHIYDMQGENAKKNR